MSALEKIQNKIFTDYDSALKTINFWRRERSKIVFTNGCFDIIHRGHIEILLKASELGNKLILGLNSDESVRNIKGPTRPVLNVMSRSLTLASFSYIDMVIIFNENTPYDLIKAIKPDVLVKGGDYRIEEIVGYDIVLAEKGEVITIDLVEGFSTTEIINKIKP